MESSLQTPENDPTGPAATQLFGEELRKHEKEVERAERLEELTELLRECLYDETLSKDDSVEDALKKVEKRKFELIDDGGEGELPEDEMPE